MPREFLPGTTPDPRLPAGPSAAAVRAAGTGSGPGSAPAAPAGTDTHCPYCALQCAMTLTPAPGSAEPAVTGRDFPTNRGGLCRKGWTSAALLGHPERLTAPLLRGPDGVHRPIGWTHALDLAAMKLAATRRLHGADAVGVFGGGALTNEKAYQLGKFARLALGTSRIDYNGRFCMSSAAAAGNRAFGVDRGLPFPVEDLDRARTILLLGSNVAETMPPFVQHLQGARAAGGLIVVDPRRTATADFTADGAGLHLQPVPATDLVLLLGLCHIVIHEGLADQEFLDSRTTGRHEVVRSVAQWWPERVQSVTGVPVHLLRETARLLSDGARSGGAYILTGRGVEQHADGTDTATAAINLALLLGLPGSANSGYGTLTGQGNGQGGREHGQKADQLPGYRKITDPAARAHVAKVWGVEPDDIPGPGLPAVELLGELGRSVRSFLIFGANVAVSAPNASKVVAGLRRLDFLVVCDFFMSETAREADLVLPVRQWAEEEGTMTNLEGRVLRRRAAVAAPARTRPELWIMAELARRLQAPSTFSDDPEAVFTELRAASAGGLADYSGIDYALLDSGAGAYWPYPAGSTGTPRLFTDAFAHPGGRAVLVPVSPAAAEPVRDALFAGSTLALVTGRLLEHYQSGAQTRRVPELAGAVPRALLLIHPLAAAARGIVDGGPVTIANARGTVRCTALHSTTVRTDTVFLPFHFPGEESANLLTGDAADPVSGMPEFKASSVAVTAGWAEADLAGAHLAGAGVPS
ncbi:assimilatory nitrate reductase catalytic subunit [Arthrobacter stackebrandtii]|uniref:Assimilatory nitrate reductase catalytic subunit n=1 Tax=Arthrobacter stackebrandtii TaxID=272161 RepID=A0ABS4YRR6_9MICC|nr:molybdopterin oxidoreductase family protein [Arthrobacter stackebrandtii]MBP2411487.1 assimilatory nitrate reductase catalytic subunit [Arthrobacter stackebrandtii]PYH00239.1 nitrite reductase [Arthrobacter stackebrandtii]